MDKKSDASRSGGNGINGEDTPLVDGGDSGHEDYVESLLAGAGELPVKTTLLAGATFEARPVQYVEVDGLAIVEGDIAIGTVEAAEQALAEDSAIAHGVVVTGERYRWDRGVVPYEIDPALPNQTRVADAIAHWHAKTKIRLVRRTAANASRYPDFVRFIPATGCYSFVGRRGGRQDIGLAPGCGTGSTIHEIGHAVGMWHEQSREDRNNYVTINYANIQPGREHNFNQHISDGDDVGRYDYGSIMHYPRKAFSKNGLDTIVPKQAGAVIGQRRGLSAGDIAAVRYMYPNLEPSTQWLGLQFTGTVPANSTRTWFTFRWPAHWYVSWIVTPETPGVRLSWSVTTERSATEDRFLTYFISVTNHHASTAARFEGRYVVHGWTPAARDPEGKPEAAEPQDAGLADPRSLVIALPEDVDALGADELLASMGDLFPAGASGHSAL